MLTVITKSDRYMLMAQNRLQSSIFDDDINANATWVLELAVEV